MPMHEAEARVAYVIGGVVEQAIRDAGARGLRLVEPVSPVSRLFARWCNVPMVEAGAALTCSLLNKTELLLAGADQRADLYPLGDLYLSELAGFAEVEPGEVVAALATLAGGVAELDAALRSLLDERRDADTAFGLAPQLREPVLARLRATRFRRAHLGLVPKLGARTIGIDLFI
jgi:hypothetical protein